MELKAADLEAIFTRAAAKILQKYPEKMHKPPYSPKIILGYDSHADWPAVIEGRAWFDTYEAFFALEQVMIINVSGTQSLLNLNVDETPQQVIKSLEGAYEIISGQENLRAPLNDEIKCRAEHQRILVNEIIDHLKTLQP